MMAKTFKIIFLSFVCLFSYSLLCAQPDNPVKVSNMAWKKAPQMPEYTNKEINCTDKDVILIIVADKFGTIEHVLIKKGSGNKGLDDKIRLAYLNASFNPDIVKSMSASGQVAVMQEITLKQRESKIKKLLGIKKCY